MKTKKNIIKFNKSQKVQNVPFQWGEGGPPTAWGVPPSPPLKWNT